MISVGHTKVLQIFITITIDINNRATQFVESPEKNSQVERVEEKHQVFALVVVQRNVLELSVDDSLALEVGGLLLQLWHSFATHLARISLQQGLHKSQTQ